MTDTDQKAAYDTYIAISKNIQSVILGRPDAVKLLLAGYACGGHILLEDNPGTGKTTLAKALALSINTDFKRVQFTPDLLPSDILGVSIFDPSNKTFKLHKGPVFTNILLVDEINRASPRTQSALLEAMAEKQVTIDGRLLKLGKLFFTIATQNPIETRGTYPLPEAQMDRFSLQFSLGYTSPETEISVLTAQDKGHPIDRLTACVSEEDVEFLQESVNNIYISEDLKRYIVEITGKTRVSEGVLLGASPRASISLMKIAKALALFDNSDYVTPEHIQQSAVNVIAHRLVIDPQARFSGITSQQIVEDIVRKIPAPA